MAMIKCHDCGKEVWEGSKICVHCGGEPFFDPFAGKIPTDEDYEEAETFDLYRKGWEFYKEQKYEQAFECFSQAAARGDAEFWYYIGVCYMNGQGVPQDYDLALMWYKKAAAKNVDRALNNLGMMYYKGMGVPVDQKKAYYYLLRASGAGSAPATANLGLMFEEGRDVPQNYENAVKLYEQAIVPNKLHPEKPRAGIYSHPGALYMEGKGTEINYDKPREMFKMGAERGSKTAEEYLTRWSKCCRSETGEKTE